MTDTDKIFEQVKLGRGLWIGLFPEPSDDLVLNRQRILDQLDERPAEMPDTDDLHITLAHLGKNVSQKFVENAHAGMEMAASMQHGKTLINMTGVLRLRKHVTIALVPDQVLKLRATLRSALHDRHVIVDDRFGMTPHMTIVKLSSDADSPRIPYVLEKPLTFGGLTMVCGEFGCVVPFNEGPF